MSRWSPTGSGWIPRAALLVWGGMLAASAALAVQSVGVAPITKDQVEPRDAAVRAAVASAATRAALELLPEDFTPPEGEIGPDGEPLSPEAWLEQRLGDDPYVYATRFRILEDRGRRRATFSADSGVDYEYVVVADVELDRDALRGRLAALGLIAGASGPGSSDQAVRLVVEGLSSHRPLALLSRALVADRGVRSVVPVEFTDGRAVLSLDADRGAGQLAAELSHRPPDGLRILVLEEGSSEATVLVEEIPEPTAPDATDPAVPAEPEGD